MSTRHTVRGITQSLPLRDVSDRRSRNGWRGPVMAGLMVSLALLSGSLAASSSAAGPSKPSAPQPPDPVIQQIMDQVTTTDLMDIDSGLSGEHSVIVGGQPYTFTTRYSRNSAGIQKTWQYAYEQFQAAGWNTSYQDYTAGGYSLKNIIAEKQGTVSPNVIYLLTAHIDDTSGSPNSYAPGADDNGSGSSLLIDAARVLAQYPMSATVRIVAFTGEEQGLWGSAAYAAAARARGDNIQGVLNADMIAWDSNNDHAGEIHAGTRADSQAIASVFSNTVTTYGVPLYLNTYTTNSETGSDHSSFWQYNYPAFLAIELDRGGDFNAYYHTINDRVNCGGNNPCGFNQSYYTAFSKALVGTLARLAVAYPPGTPTPTVTGTPPTATPTFTPSNTATATPTSCSNYVYATGTATVIAGVTDIGNHTDDGVTFVTFPFPVKVYGQTYTGGNASSNGNFQLSGGQSAWQPECLPSTSVTGPTIFLYWEDLVTSCSGCGIYSTIVGTAPNREFVLEWRAQPYPSGSTLDFEMLFPEYQVVNSEEFDLVYGSVASGGVGATVGVQAGDGVHYTQFECGTGGLTENLKIVFTLPPCGTPVATSTATATHTSTATPSFSSTPTPTSNCGAAWRIVSNSPGNSLYAVSALSPDDVWAVGANQSGAAFSEHWNGAQWSVVPVQSMNGASLQGVEAIAPGDVWAVGTYLDGNSINRTLIEHWNGSAWSVVSSPNASSFPNLLRAVSAVASNDVWAVGVSNDSITHTLVEHWDGSSWSIASSPSPGTYANALNAVKAISAGDVWAVGYSAIGPGSQTLVEHWNGSTWSVVSSPSPGIDQNYLNGVSASSAANVWAVGYKSTILNGPLQTLIERWDGSAWSVVASPNVGNQNTLLNGVSAVASGAAFAAGYTLDGGQTSHTLVEQWDGSQWAIVPSPDQGTGSNQLSAITFDAGSGAWAVGTAWNGATPNTLTERYSDPCITPTPPAPTSTATPSYTATPRSTETEQATSTLPPATLTTQATETPPATATSTACAIQFSDVPEGSTFYSFVRCLACRGIISGYPDGTFRPGNQVTRGQLTKIVSNSAGWNDEIPPDRQTFEDVPPGSTFWLYVERAVLHLAASGYQCGGPGEPCVPPNNRPYFHPNAPALRGQVVKIISNAAGLNGQPSGQTFQDVDPSHPYYVFVERLAALGSLQGYPCGQVPAEPCVPPQNRPYARPYSSVTRGQAAKLDANTFFPGCQTPSKAK